VRRRSAWHGLLIAGAIALAAAQTVHADPLPLPQVNVPPVTVPPVTVPPVTVPPVTVPPVSVPGVPQVSTPQVSTPQVSTPQVSTPQVSTPQVSTPQVSRPAVPRGTRPAAPQVTTTPRSSTPTPTRTQQRAGAPRSQTRSSAAPVGPAGNSGGSSGSSGTPRASGDAKPGAKTPARRAGRTAREPSSKRLRRLLKPLAGCVASLGPLQERVLVRRAGLRGFKPQTRRQLAKTLHTSATRVARIERRALGNLRRTARAGGCTTPASSAPAPGAASPAGTLVAERVAAPAQTGGGESASERTAVKGVAESQSDSMIESVASTGRDALAAISEPARSFADDHPLTFTLVVLATLLCGVLFVRELRRSV